MLLKIMTLIYHQQQPVPGVANAHAHSLSYNFSLFPVLKIGTQTSI